MTTDPRAVDDQLYVPYCSSLYTQSSYTLVFIKKTKCVIQKSNGHKDTKIFVITVTLRLLIKAYVSNILNGCKYIKYCLCMYSRYVWKKDLYGH